jgi:hypothetical protein
MKPCRVCGNYGPFSPSRIAKQNWICHPCNEMRGGATILTKECEDTGKTRHCDPGF